MAKEYSELIKNYNNVRRYIRDFYIYGLKSRSEYNYKSSRSYDDELRRINSWLSEYVDYNENALNGKAYYISVDTRSSRHNPLYNTYKTCSFTDKTLKMNFSILDVLYSPEIKLTLSELLDEIDVEDESTLRKKLDKFVDQGILIKTLEGRTAYYSRYPDIDFKNIDALHFFSEVGLCGVIGSYLLDKYDIQDEALSFKHHYINSALDSIVLEDILYAIFEHKSIVINDKEEIIPLRLYINTQGGRHFVMSYSSQKERIQPYRIDRIDEVSIKGKVSDIEKYYSELDLIKDNIWNVSVGKARNMEHVEFILTWEEGESFIYNRLLRESHNAKITRLSDTSARFSCDCYDANELTPWIRTFICRITYIKFSNEELDRKFKKDLEEMYKLYDLSGREEN